jgi:hypothetical protein
MESLKKNIYPALAAGAVAGLASSMYYGVSGSVSVAGMSIPATVAVGATVGAGYLAGEILSEYVTPMLISDSNTNTMLESVIPVALSGASSYIFISVMITPNALMTQSVMLGSASAVAGKYIDTAVLEPYFN